MSPYGSLRFLITSSAHRLCLRSLISSNSVVVFLRCRFGVTSTSSIFVAASERLYTCITPPLLIARSSEWILPLNGSRFYNGVLTAFLLALFTTRILRDFILATANVNISVVASFDDLPVRLFSLRRRLPFTRFLIANSIAMTLSLSIILPLAASASILYYTSLVT